MVKKHTFPVQMWAMEDGGVTKFKYDGMVFVREDIIKRDFIRNAVSYPKKKPRKKNNNNNDSKDGYSLFVKWMDGKEFVSFFRFKNEYPSVSEKEISKIRSRLISEDKLQQLKKDEFRVL